jgi:hypothetical protein
MGDQKIGVNKEDVLISSLFYYLVAPLPALFISYRLSDFIYETAIWLTEVARDVSESSTERMRYAAFVVMISHVGNVFLRIYPFVGFGLVIAAILMMRTANRTRLVWGQKLSCAVRANCVSVITLLAMTVTGFLNPASERFTEQMVEGGMPIFWSQIFVGLGMFVLTQRFFLRVVEINQQDFETEKRGLERSKGDETEEDIFIPKPSQAE